jgi:hypothetical protein
MKKEGHQDAATRTGHRCQAYTIYSIFSLVDQLFLIASHPRLMGIWDLPINLKRDLCYGGKD